jgi:hypothetical protein
MLCATAEVKSPAASISHDAERSCILGDVMGRGLGGVGEIVVVIIVVAGAERPAKRDKLAIIRQLGAFAAGLRLGRLRLQRDLLGSGSRASAPPIGWIVQVE